jgi:hypothetical protein
MSRELKDREKNKETNGPVLATSLEVCRGKENMLNRTVTGDESWVHHYQPESKHALI